jgi:hypothetical protein
MVNPGRTARRFALPGILLAAGILAGWPVIGHDTPVSSSQVIARIETAFRQGEAARLRPLLPQRGKVQLALPSLGLDRGYFSGSQCEALLSGAFRRFPVQSFVSERQEQSSGADNRLTLRGLLIVEGGDEAAVRLNLHFLLVQESDRWTLREIREHHGR